MPFACTLHLALVFLSLTAVKENTLPAGGQGCSSQCFCCGLLMLEGLLERGRNAGWAAAQDCSLAETKMLTLVTSV